MSYRVGAFLGAVGCALLLGFGYYLQYVRGLEPCPLCLVQRGFFYLVLAVFLAAAMHGPAGRIAALYSSLAALFALGGAATAGRQLWLQSLPADKVPACGPDLYFMLENFPLSRTLEKLFHGTGECAVVDWSFLGLSIAGWSFAWFLAFAAYAAWLAVRALRSARAPDATFPEVNGRYR
ncbi:MAG: disulfide bond formation protein B [Burkholderiales bacterium]